jgi:hypothetical protein
MDHPKYIILLCFKDTKNSYVSHYCLYEGNSISKLQIVIEKKRMEMTCKQHLFFNVISIQI